MLVFLDGLGDKSPQHWQIFQVSHIIIRPIVKLELLLVFNLTDFFSVSLQSSYLIEIFDQLKSVIILIGDGSEDTELGLSHQLLEVEVVPFLMTESVKLLGDIRHVIIMENLESNLLVASQLWTNNCTFEDVSEYLVLD